MTTKTVRRPDNDPELCQAQRELVQFYGGETREVIEAIRLMASRPDITLEFVRKAYLS